MAKVIPGRGPVYYYHWEAGPPEPVLLERKGTARTFPGRKEIQPRRVGEGVQVA